MNWINKTKRYNKIIKLDFERDECEEILDCWFKIKKKIVSNRNKIEKIIKIIKII